MMNCQNPMTLYQLCIIMHVEPSGFDFIYNGNNSISGKIFEPIIITNGITTTEAQALAAFKTANAFQAGFTSV